MTEQSIRAHEIKSCCADAYAGAAARWLLGDVFHPGGEKLTYELVEALGVGSEHTVVDVASGPGTSALLLARLTGCSVVGVDLAAESVAFAGRAAAEAGLAGRVRFVEGDAEALPLADASVDGALCECSFCLFPDKDAAARELARVLRPGARLALSDVTAEPERLPAELRTLAARVACLADAQPLELTAAQLESAGFAVERLERRDGALGFLVQRIRARLRLARLLGPNAPDGLVDSAGRGLELAAAAETAVREGVLGYAVVVARRA